MNYVDFFGHKVSKLIVGDNPFNGHCYIKDHIDGKEMLLYHTEDKILEAIHLMEDLGVNTMLPLADPYIIRILQHYRSNGGKMNFIFQSYGPFMTKEMLPVTIRMMSEVEPIAVYLSGTYGDVRFETGRNEETKIMLADMHQMGIPIGFGTHHPELIRVCEEEGWAADFYMACMYNLRRNREGEESGFITGKSKQGVIVRPSDRPLMLDALQGIEKPIIAFKIFGGGQMLVEKPEAERRKWIKDTYNTIFNSLKPDDFAVMGIFQKYHDQLTENISVYNEWLAEQNG